MQIGNGITITNCVINDYTFIHDLSKDNMGELVSKFWGKWDSDKFKESFKSENIKLIYYKNEKIGFFNLSSENELSYLHSIQLISEFQGKGIGKKVMQHIEKEEKKQNRKKMQLQVFKENRAKNFYEKLNYLIIKDNDTSVVMEKELK